MSFQTTSKVLNGQGSVSEITRKRILRAAKDLGYVRNLQARSLVMRRTRTIGLVVGDFSDQNLSRFIVGAEQEARRQAYGVIISGLEPSVSAADYALPALMERRVDGMVLAATQIEGDRPAARALAGTVPAVSLYPMAGGGVTTVGSDQESIGLLATEHLLRAGHRQIATVIGLREQRMTQARLRGYRRALKAAGVVFDGALVEEGGWEIAGAMDATRRLFVRRPGITAIFAQSDAMAIGVLNALRSLRKKAPRDCAIVGCDDTDMAANATPPLTTIHQPFYETGQQAVRLLLGLISNGSAAPREVMLPVRLIPRASSATGPVESARAGARRAPKGIAR